MEPLQRRRYISQQLENMEFVAPSEFWTQFRSKIEKQGGIVERWIEGEFVTSPSVQGLIRGPQDVIVLSTHEQILNQEGSMYLGCHFPADLEYRDLLKSYCEQIGRVLASRGARERYAVDFVATRTPNGSNSHQVYAIEINLRSGGTTHPFEIARQVCGASFHPNGTLQTREGVEKCYQASDNVVHSSFSLHSLAHLVEVLQGSPVHWNPHTLRGCLFYFLGALKLHGKVGLLAIGNSRQDASSLFEEAILTLVTSSNQQHQPKREKE